MQTSLPRAFAHFIAWARPSVKAERPFFVVLAVLLTLGTTAGVASAGAPRIALLSMGPGDAFVSLFGHDALVVEPLGSPARVYNFGMYTPESLTLARILAGQLRYSLSVDPYDRTIAYYRSENRSLIAQELDLDEREANELARALAHNARPENASYRYDYGLDNCTTRVRDALDRATAGALRRAIRGPSPYTYRDHALRLTAHDPRLYFFFDLGLGARADRRLDAWDDAYLPDRLAEHLRTVRRPGSRGDRPLVLREHDLLRAARADVRKTPPRRAALFALAGSALAGLLVWLGRHPHRHARTTYGTLLVLLGIAVGVLGTLLAVLLVTNVHPVAHRNVNVLFCSPLAFALIPLGTRAVRGHSTRRSLPIPELVCLASALAGVAAMFALAQDSTRIALLFVPFWLGAFLAAWRPAARSSGSTVR